MQSVKTLLALGTKDEFKRVNREAFLFELINHFDKPDGYLPDNTENTSGYQKPSLTIAQKRRLRNEIVRKATSMAKNYNETHKTPVSVDDYQVLLHAFFETNYGSKYASHRNEWLGYAENANRSRLTAKVSFGDALDMIERVERSNAENDILISPYDPAFVSSDAFYDANHDALGHFARSANDDAIVDHVMLDGEMFAVEGPLNKCGYAQLSHYIKTKKNAESVRSFLLSNIDKITQDERDFMISACQYLSNIGIEYDISVGDNEVKLSTNTGVEVRLFDAKDGAKYAGRMYAGGHPLYLGVTGNRNGAEANNDKVITNKDRLDALRWYFGTESVAIDERDASGKHLTSNRQIGSERQPVPVGTNRSFSSLNISPKYKNMMATYRSTSGGHDASNNSGIMLSYVHGDGANEKPSAVSLFFGPLSSTKYKSAEREFYKSIVDLSIAPMVNPTESNSYAWNKFRASVAPEDIIPGDEEMITLEDGSNSVQVKSAVEQSHAVYYRHLPVRNTLNEWVESARTHHQELVNIDDIYANYELFLKDKNHILAPTGDDSVDELRNMYWRVLTGSATEEDIKNFVDTTLDDEVDDVEIEENSVDTPRHGYADGLDTAVVTSGTVDDKLKFIKAHYSNYLNAEIGSVPYLQKPGQPEVDNTGRGFNPEKVARYSQAEKSNGIQKNYDYIRHMLKRLEDDYDASWISTDNYISKQIKNDLIRYNPDKVLFTASYNQLMSGKGLDATFVQSHPVTFDMLKHTANMLATSGCDINSITLSIDDNGIVQYHGIQSTKRYSVEPYEVSGYIGQIFEPDEYGVIDPKYVVDTDMVFVPGYNAFLVENDLENPQEMRDRLRLVGWETQMKTAIAQEIHNACFYHPEEANFLPHTASLNRVYRKSYDTRFTREYYQEHLPQPGKKVTPEQRTFLNTIETLRGRCRFSNAYDENATTMAQSMLEHPDRQESKDYDFYYSDLCDNENLRVMGEYFDGIFDPNMTGTARTQGIVRYLCQGARETIDTATGKVTGVSYKGDNVPECALMSDPLFKYKYFDTWDRREMAASQVLTAWHTPRNIGTAMITLDGWTFDDGFVVSKRFADSYPVKDLEGNMRSLMAQDKLSDMHGNKGVIGLVVDPEMASDVIANRLFTEIMGTEADEFDLSVDGFYNALIDSPYNDSISNFNGSTLQLNMDGEEYVVNIDVNSDEDRIMQVAKSMYNTKLLKTLHNQKGEFIQIGKPFEFDYDGQTYSVVLDGKSSESYLTQMAYAVQDAHGVKGLDDVMHFFRDNPDLDVVMSPHSGMSRFNGGTVVNMMDNPSDLVVNGETIEGGMGHIDLIVVDMLADVKSHFYGETELREGKGRKASAQLAWALQAKGANAIMNEFYGENGKAFDDFREYSISIGLDIDENLQPVVGYHQQKMRNEHRRLFKLPSYSDIDLKYVKGSKTKGKGNYYLADDCNEKLTDKFLDDLNKSGGFIELPFALNFSTLNFISGPAAKDHPLIKEHPEAFMLQQTNQSVDLGTGEGVVKTYGLPVLSANLRSGQDFQDGTSKPHDYTKMYLDIYRNALLYMGYGKESQQIKADMAAAKSEAEKEALSLKLEALNELKNGCQSAAQSQFDEIVKDVLEKRFNTKHNVVRDEIMTKRMTDSATAVWSADPRLNLDEVSMSLDNAVKLNLIKKDKETGELMKNDKGDYIIEPERIIVFRDPVLHPGGVRYLKVVLDNRNLKGICINPLIDKSFDGDFDGDSAGLKVLRNKDAISQAFSTFSFNMNLLDKNTKATITNPDNPEETIEGYNLYIQSGLDRAANEMANPELKQRIDRLTWQINQTEAIVEKINNGELANDETSGLVYNTVDKYGKEKTYYGLSAATCLRKDYFPAELSKWAHEVMDAIGNDHMVVKDKFTVAESIQRIVDNKSKGSQSKAADYAENLGMTYELGDDGRIDISTVDLMYDEQGNRCSKDMRDGTRRAKDKSIQETTAYKADNTQLGGTAAQRGVAAFRNEDINAALLLTYPVTQAILQSKHDPKDAKIKDEIVRFWGGEVWNGYKLTGNWNYEEWKQSVMIDAQKQGLSVEEIEKRTSADAFILDLQKQPHHKIKELVLDADGNRIPVMTKQVNEVTGKYEYVQKVDENGDAVWETTYAKCSRSEWIDQMKGMFTALKVEINPDYIERVADIMTSKNEVPLTSAETGRIITYDKGQTMAMNKHADSIIGVDDYMKYNGTLLDKLAYFGRAGALVNTAIANTPEYKDFASNAYAFIRDHGNELSNSLMGNVMKYAVNINEATSASAYTQARNAIPNSASFVPKTVLSEVYGDIQRAKKNEGKAYGEGDDYFTNEIIGKRGAVVSKQAVPIGRSDCRSVDLTLGEAYMGESQDEYNSNIVAYEKLKAEHEAAQAVKRNVALDLDVPSEVPDSDDYSFADSKLG